MTELSSAITNWPAASAASTMVALARPDASVIGV
jgi:hypothetical protein